MQCGCFKMETGQLRKGLLSSHIFEIKGGHCHYTFLVSVLLLLCIDGMKH